MKRTRLSVMTGLILLSAVSCSEKELADNSIPITFSLESVAQTKGTSSSLDTGVSQWTVFVCDGSGNVVASASTSSSSIVLNVPKAGSYAISTFVNGNIDPNGVTRVDMASNQVSLSGEKSALKMYGYGTYYLGTGTSATCRLPVTRLVSKVEIDKISVDFSDHPDLQNKSFVINAIYLTNVCGTTKWEGTLSSVSNWYNIGGFTSAPPTSVRSLIYDSGINYTVTAAKPYTVPRYYYCYPNTCTSDVPSSTGSSFSRFSRLVVQATLDGRTYYYPVDLQTASSPMQRNRLYKITEMVIKRRGSLNMDDPDGKDAVDVKFSVTEDWSGLAQIFEES